MKGHNNFQNLARPLINLGTPLALLHKTYILSQTQTGFCLIDMHAAHERLTYERLKAQMAMGPIPQQTLLFPEIVALSPEQKETLMGADLAALGLVIHSFDGDKRGYSGRSCPVGGKGKLAANVDRFGRCFCRRYWGKRSFRSS